MKLAFSLSAQQLGHGSLHLEWQKKSSMFLAAVGGSHVVYIFDRSAQVVDTFPLAGECRGMEWSPDGSVLAVIQAKSSYIFLWDADSRKASANPFDTGMKHLHFLKWSPKGDYLAAGTAKGNLFICDKTGSEKVPILGKHNRSICAGCWSWDNILACGSEDNTFSLSNSAGDTVFSMGISGEPSLMEWANMKNANGTDDPVLSMIVGHKSLLVHNINQPDKPVELAFQAKYGRVASYQWFADGFVLVGFETGYLIVISTSPANLGHEIFATKNHKTALSSVAVSLVLGKAASCGDNTVKVHELADLRDVYAVENIDDVSPLDKVQWSEDGQFLSTSTKDGSIYTYVAQMPMLGSASGTAVAYLSGLREISVLDLTATLPPFRKELEMEPTHIALGGSYLGVVSRNSAGFFRFVDTPTDAATNGPTLADSLVMLKDYEQPVKRICMNGHYAAVLLEDGQLYVHSIQDDTRSDKRPPQSPLHDITSFTRGVAPPPGEISERFYPDSDSDKSKSGKSAITCVALTPECLVFGTATKSVKHYLLDSWTLASEFTHMQAIRAVYPQPRGGTKLVFVDKAKDGFLADPASNNVMPIPRWSANAKGVVWDSEPPAGRAIFVAWDDTTINTYVYQASTVKGPTCTSLGSTRLPAGQKPVLLFNGTVTCQTLTGRVATVNLATHASLEPSDVMKADEPEQGKILQLFYMLGMLKNLWALIGLIKARRPWITLAETALRMMDIATANRIYRQALQDASMVWTLDQLASVEEKNLLAGHVSAILGDATVAQDFFLKSSYPKAALDLRRNLMHWEQALGLANTLAPEQITVIAKEYAKQLEMNGQYAEALAMYERALSTSEHHPGKEQARDEHQIFCSGGLAKMTLRMGDVSRGMKMLSDTTDKQLLFDCGMILDSLRQYNEAGLCFEKGGYWEKAAEVWIKAKTWSKLGNILDRVSSRQIFVQYARAREDVRDYTEAARAYEKAKDYDNVVRLFIDHLQNVEGAVAIVRRTRSRESARLVAKVFQSMRDYRAVVEFYLMAGMRQEAFELAQQKDVMEHFAEMVKEDASSEELANIATFLENKGNFLLAGKYLLQAAEYPRALRMFLQSAPEGIELAIETVGVAKSDTLTHQLIDFLMGETDGVPKDAKYIFKLYMSLGQYREAARTAIIIAREEQALGNYRAAHDLLFDNYKQLRATRNHVPAEIERMLMLVHSYMLVKALIKHNDHEKGARMLIRVANNISKFPAHVVPILTSTVVECYRVGFKRAAFEYGAILMRPENRNKVDAKYKARIEKIVRRPEKDETEEPMSPCPFCNAPVANTTLDCTECKNHIPYCIATGQHMVLSNWTVCPSCAFPALYTEFRDFLDKTPSCVMCSATLNASQLRQLSEAEASSILHGKKQETDETDGKETAVKETESENGHLNKSRSSLRRSKESVRIVKGGSTGNVAADTGERVEGM
ncbi:WD repeat-containing protein 19-like protein [Fimicolochytrium jonesii]|uniref:WD repeat-containing protein 19-like protein n=1 Tax=Fimicolochytrium jonesii TaxID=1396493 RepID=UPI0022FDFBEC|nr:WD repeat-containing protein 19-like protein [Fimicolochytrium jonesii]KAI8820676.1 WD repeat-containing protein 19-like protein [Fimicolochytrium jonesii]